MIVMMIIMIIMIITVVHHNSHNNINSNSNSNGNSNSNSNSSNEETSSNHCDQVNPVFGFSRGGFHVSHDRSFDESMFNGVIVIVVVVMRIKTQGSTDHHH